MKGLKLAVIGKDVSKSDSPRMHKFIANSLGYDVDYEKISIPEGEFEEKADDLFQKFDGFNVTIPYKLAVIEKLNKTEGDATAFGAVNTVVTSTKTGYNTDGLGFMMMLENEGVEVAGKKVLIIGAGGAGRSVAKKLSDAGATVEIYDKNASLAAAVANEFSGVRALDKIELTPYYALINASGVGMHKSEGLSPVGADLIEVCEVAIDLIYVPAKSRFLEIAEGLGKKIINGKAMLFYQAYFAECIYAGLTPNHETAKSLFLRFEEEK